MAFINRYLLWPLLLVSHLLVACLLAWHLLAQVNFGYALAYPLLSIEKHIETFGPQNEYKPAFHTTDTDEHHRLFGEITHAVQSRGDGLAEISYPLPDGGREPLLRDAEVTHLDDVAELIAHCYRAGLIAALVLITALLYAHRMRLTLPRLKRIAAGFAAGVGAIAVAVLLIGPVSVFYWLHEVVFPSDNEWFFYYQESLMTTLMKAPDLFGFITVLLLVVTALLWYVSLKGIHRLLARPPGKHPGKPQKPADKARRKTT